MFPSSRKVHYWYEKIFMNALAAVQPFIESRLGEGVFFFHQGRCGSTVLADLLDQHPELRSFNEIFERYYKRRTVPTCLENILLSVRVRAGRRRVVAEAKFFESQDLKLFDEDLQQLISLLKKSGYRKFIVLERKNYLRLILSLKIALKRGGVWHLGVDSPKIEAISAHIDPKDVNVLGLKKASLPEVFAYMDSQYAALYHALGAEDYLRLRYEGDIQNDPTIAYEKVCNWLGMKDVPVSTKYRKTVTTELSKAIDNWDEVSEALTGTKYEWMLHDGMPYE